MALVFSLFLLLLGISWGYFLSFRYDHFGDRSVVLYPESYITKKGLITVFLFIVVIFGVANGEGFELIGLVALGILVGDLSWVELDVSYKEKTKRIVYIYLINKALILISLLVLYYLVELTDYLFDVYSKPMFYDKSLKKVVPLKEPYDFFAIFSYFLLRAFWIVMHISIKRISVYRKIFEIIWLMLIAYIFYLLMCILYIEFEDRYLSVEFPEIIGFTLFLVGLFVNDILSKLSKYDRTIRIDI